MSDGALQFDPRALVSLYAGGRHAALADELLRLLTHFARHGYPEVDARTRHAVDTLCQHFLHLFTQPDFRVDRGRLLRFIGLNTVIANLVAISDFRTTDPWLALLLGQRDNALRLMALYNPFCRTVIPRSALFDADRAAASTWFAATAGGYLTAPAGEASFRWLREHLSAPDPRTQATVELVATPFYAATYLDPDRDHVVKRLLNESLQRWAPLRTAIDNRPDPRRVAVLTGKWFANHSVYRCLHGYLERLAGERELTLFHLGPGEPDIDTRLFAGGVRRFALAPAAPDLSPFTPNRFALAFYPDVGMTVESIVLSNLRIAPVQVAGYGHPVSTHGSRIDYWIGGRAVESIEHAARNYSERLVLIPGAGVAPLRPVREPAGIEPPRDRIVIGAPWSSFKTNAPLLGLVERIIAGSGRPVRLRLLPGAANLANGLVPFRRTLADRLGAGNVEVADLLPYDEYLRALEGCHFCLDSWPFGGYATVTDCLWLRRPVVSIEGTRFYNRAGAHLLRDAGLPELVVDSPDAFVETALRLVRDDAWREALTARLRATDLDQALFGADHADAFCRAIALLVDRHERLAADGDRAPILVD